MPATLFVHQMRYGPAQNFQYLIASSASKTAFLVDPAWDVDALLGEVETLGLSVVGALVTHHHRDHCDGVPRFVQLTGQPVYAHSADLHAVPGGAAVTAIEDGQVIGAEDLQVLCMHTPGHTAGSVSFLAGSDLCTGDTLFVGTIGRVDLPDSSAESLFWSLRKLGMLPDETAVYPGHDYADRPSSTIGEQKQRNPYMRVNQLEDFLSFVR
jgi:glyoxylase-like metal-dependent hydrolase (beta-lactamase superfamily II)